jgi:hypothetical protein
MKRWLRCQEIIELMAGMLALRRISAGGPR